MERSLNFNFYLPSRDTDDIADINQISDNFRIIDNEVQEKLESGENIKTINNQSLLGSGNIEIQGGLGEADQTYSPTSPNAQSGIAVAEAVSGKMDRFGDVTALGDINIDTGESVLRDVRILLDAPKLILNTQDEENAELCGIATPDGIDPTQAANVEFVKKARDMRLIRKKTVTAEDATYFIYDKDTEGNPINLDEIYMFVNIPSGTSSCSMAVYINGVLDAEHTFSYIQHTSGTGTYWAHAERIADGRWKTLRAALHERPSSRPLYANYDLEPINYINTIRLNGFAAGITFEIWGRDAI